MALPRYRHSPRGATRCFGGPGSTVADQPQAEGEGARSLRLRREGKGPCARTSAPLTAALAGKTPVEATTRSAKAGTGQAGGVTGVGLGEAKNTGCGERGSLRAPCERPQRVRSYVRHGRPRCPSANAGGSVSGTGRGCSTPAPAPGRIRSGSNRSTRIRPPTARPHAGSAGAALQKPVLHSCPYFISKFIWVTDGFL
jgi:hypothetical protein